MEYNSRITLGGPSTGYQVLQLGTDQRMSLIRSARGSLHNMYPWPYDVHHVGKGPVKGTSQYSRLEYRCAVGDDLPGFSGSCNESLVSHKTPNKRLLNRCIQIVQELVPRRQQPRDIAAGLNGRILRLATNEHGYRIVTGCLERLPEVWKRSMLQEIQAEATFLMSHKYGVRDLTCFLPKDRS